jgi:ABC-type histidine transport system ATPase subunit
MSHVRRLANHVFFMYGGRIEEEGSLDEIVNSSANPHLRQYLRVYGGTASLHGTEA